MIMDSKDRRYENVFLAIGFGVMVFVIISMWAVSLGASA